MESPIEDYYKKYAGPEVFRIPMGTQKEFKLDLPTGVLQAKLYNISALGQEIVIGSGFTGWLYLFGGESLVSPLEGDSIKIISQDLLYLRSGAEFLVSSTSAGSELKAFLVTRTCLPSQPTTNEPHLIVKMPSRTSKPVDWVGNWLPGITDATMHTGREGTGSLSPDNPKAEFPLHKHNNIIEVFFTAKGRSILNIVRNGNQEKVPMGPLDMFVVLPGVFHGMGNPKVGNLGVTKANKTYSAYEGIAFKIPMNDTPVSAKDKLFA